MGSHLKETTYRFSVVVGLIIFLNACFTNTIQMDTVIPVDINRYAGKWYEIARFPHSFEKNLEGVTATYTLRADGKIDVLNKGYKGSPDGKPKTIKGVAKIPDKDRPDRLKVKFFLFFWAEYNILELDQEEYNYALVGSSSPGFLWILCREPKMDDDVYLMLVNRAAELGYATEKLIRVRHQSENPSGEKLP